MIESLLDFYLTEKKPWLTFIWAVLVTSIAIIISTQIQPVPGVDFGFFTVLFTIIPSVYFISLLITKEEEIEEKRLRRGQKTFWEMHSRDILILLFYFFGVTFAYALWTFALPDGLFTSQLDKISSIRGTGAFTGAVAQEGVLATIFTNNLQVLAIAFIFSLVFGAGAIFIIVWNASVLGVYIGELSKSLWQIPLISLSFLPHGIPEIAGYLASGLAGGLISAAILRKRQKLMGRILWDSVKLLGWGVAFIALAAVIEVYL